ncbi:MAG TPA: TonB-dependent receptor, partial [Rhizomicrobium sp.]
RAGDLKNLDPNAKGDLNAINLNAGRAALSFAPSDRFSADLIFNYQQDKTNGTGFKSMYMSPTDPATGQVLAGTKTDDPVWLSTSADFAGGRDLGVDQNYGGVTGLLNYRLNDTLTLHSVTGYRDVGSIEVYDADGTSLPIYTVKEDNGGTFFSQELRLAYDNGGAFSWFVGGSYYRERARSKVDIRFDERMLLAQAAGMLNGGPLLGLPATTPAPAGLFANSAFTGAIVQGLAASLSQGNILMSAADASALAARLDPAHVEHQNNTADLDSYDLFGDVTWRPAENWEFSAGLRYSTDNKITRWASSVDARSILGGIIGATGIAASGNPADVATAKGLLAGLTAYGTSLAAPIPAFAINTQPTANNGDTTARNLDDDGLTWRLTGRYIVSASSNIYASYARGRRPAVLSAAAPSAPGGTPVFTVAPAETADAYEIGYKASLGAVNFDAAFFYYDYQNFQTRELVGSTFVTTNAGTAQSYGVELQGNWQADPMLDLFTTYSYTHARFGNGAYKDNSFARSPDHMFSLGASVNVRGLDGMFHLRPSYSYRSKIFFADDNDKPQLQTGRIVPDLIQDEYQNGFGLLNLRLAYVPDDANWQIEAFADNALDTVYRKGAGSAGESIGLPTNVRGEPRVYGLRVSVHY